jgi:hypothetical protein
MKAPVGDCDVKAAAVIVGRPVALATMSASVTVCSERASATARVRAELNEEFEGVVTSFADATTGASSLAATAGDVIDTCSTPIVGLLRPDHPDRAR